MRVTPDTNVLVRAAVGDDPLQSPAAARALQTASLIAVTNPALCEFVWVLSRAYKRSAADIAGAIRTLLAAGNVAADRPAVGAGLAFLEAGGDFADGIIAYEGAELGAEVFLSFDADAIASAKARQIGAAMPS